MEENRDIRINKVLRELNISLERAVEFLKRNKIIINQSPNSKVSNYEYSILSEQFENKIIPKSIKEIEASTGTILFEKWNNSNEFLLNNFYVLNEKSEITGLNIYHVEISDISFLVKNKKITYLSLVDCGLKDIKPLLALKELKSLHLQTNNISNYSILKELRQLEELSLADGTISDFKTIPSHTKILSLKDCNIRDIEFIREFENIENLDLSYNIITDISALEGLQKLKKLDLSFNKISNISVLSKFIFFDSLNLSYNRIENISSLKTLRKILTLDMSYNIIIDIYSLSKFNFFEFLDLSNNQINDITALKGTQFIRLYIENNKIIDLTPLYEEFRKDGNGAIKFLNNPILYPPKVYEREDGYNIWNWFENNLNYARERISDYKNSKSKVLNLGNCGLTDLSLLPELFEGTENIEELIISNHYASYDVSKNYWNREETIGIYPNNIYNIPNDISKLKNLKVLIIGGDWRTGEEWNRWRIKSINNLVKLKKLEILNVSNNQILSLPKLNSLTNLQTLHANNNKIKNVEPFGYFASLKELYLSNNEISEVGFLKDLKSVVTLDLHGNKIKDVSEIVNLIYQIGIEDSKWNINTINLKDNNLDEAFVNILRNYPKENRKTELENYFKRLKQGNYIVIKRMKLILLGNTRAGKTTLADILSNENKSKYNSTHGINFFHFEIEDIDIRGYDFGGQDYYHNTHYSFFDNKAMYVIVWGNEQSNSFEVKDQDILFPLNYWIGSLNVYAYEDIITRFYEYLLILSKHNKSNINLTKILEENQLPVFDESQLNISIENFIKNSNLSFKNLKYKLLSVLSKIELNDKTSNFSNNDFPFSVYLFQNLNINKIWLNELQLKETYGYIQDFLEYNFLKDSESIENFFNEKAKDFINETKVLKIDNELGYEFEKNKERVVIDLEEVKNLKEEIKGYTPNELDSLLRSLDSVLSCYYFKVKEEIKVKLENPNLQNIVIVDIEKFTSWIYQILDQRDKKLLVIEQDIEQNKIDYFSKEKEGYFTKQDAEKWLVDLLAVDYLDYILAFMLQNKLIFKMKNQERFFAPNYLNDKQTKTEKLFLNSFPKPIVKYIFKEYFHTSILSEIINEFFDKLLIEDNKMKYVLWRNKVLLYESEGTNKLVYLSFQINSTESPSITVSRFNDSVSDSFILQICSFIESFIKCYDYEKMILSKNGIYIPYYFLDSNNMTKHEKSLNIFTFEGIIYKKSDFKMFLTNKEDYPMKKVFISYSHTDSGAMKELCKFLKGLERNGQIEKWTDLQLQAGLQVKKEILTKLEEADIVIMLISQNFISSDFIYDNELPAAMKKKINGSGAIIPVYLSDSTIFDLELNINDDEKNRLKMGNYYFTPQDDENNLKAIEEWEFPAKAWKKVYDEVRKLLN